MQNTVDVAETSSSSRALMQLVPHVEARTSTRWNMPALLSVLRRMLEEEIARNSFLSDYGITLFEQNSIAIAIQSSSRLGMNEHAVGLVLKSLLESRLARHKILDGVVLTLASPALDKSD